MVNNQLKENRIGEVSYTKYGTKAVIIEYVNYNKVLVEFQDQYKYSLYIIFKFSKGHVDKSIRM